VCPESTLPLRTEMYEYKQNSVRNTTQFKGVTWQFHFCICMLSYTSKSSILLKLDILVFLMKAVYLLSPVTILRGSLSFVLCSIKRYRPARLDRPESGPKDW
jgi:hypothetical protein